jgi:predicted dehydrogenase
VREYQVAATPRRLRLRRADQRGITGARLWIPTEIAEARALAQNVSDQHANGSKNCSTFPGELKMENDMTRRDFLDHATKAGIGVTTIAAAGSGLVANAAAKKRVALVGTGIRGTTMWGSSVARTYGELVEFVGLCDINRKRVEVGKQMIGADCPTFTEFDRWALEADPVEVTAFGELRNYGRSGKLRGKNCRNCSHKTDCKFYWDMTRDATLMKLYADCESEDGYLRDACVYREDINIWDTMTANVKYSNGALMSYSLNTFMPYEGYHLAFNGTDGRLDVRAYERQPWTPPAVAEVRVTKNFGKSELIEMKVGLGGHFGADPRLKEMVFKPDVPDPLKQRAGSRAGAMSLLTGVASVRSIEQRKPIKIADLIKL